MHSTAIGLIREWHAEILKRLQQAVPRNLGEIQRPRTDPTHFYHHHEDHQQGFHTPPPYRIMPYGFSPPNNVHGYQDVGNNMSKV